MFYGKYELTTSNFPFFFCMWMWFLKILPLLEKLLMGLKRPRLGCRYRTYGSTRPESLKKPCGVGASYLRNYDGVFSKLHVNITCQGLAYYWMCNVFVLSCTNLPRGSYFRFAQLNRKTKECLAWWISAREDISADSSINTSLVTLYHL